MITSVALAHLVDATQHIGVVGGVGGDNTWGGGWGGGDNIRCICQCFPQ